jgi:hypothetical protein
MLDKLKKNSVKIFFFTINILLAAIAVLVIREKDQARLLENTQKEILANENAQSSSSLPSFENSVSAEGVQSDSSQANVSETSPSTNNSVVVPKTSAPATTPVSSPSNAKTKTS